MEVLFGTLPILEDGVKLPLLVVPSELFDFLDFLLLLYVLLNFKYLGIKQLLRQLFKTIRLLLNVLVVSYESKTVDEVWEWVL